jgi:hypothetical protein
MKEVLEGIWVLRLSAFTCMWIISLLLQDGGAEGLGGMQT